MMEWSLKVTNTSENDSKNLPQSIDKVEVPEMWRLANTSIRVRF